MKKSHSKQREEQFKNTVAQLKQKLEDAQAVGMKERKEKERLMKEREKVEETFKNALAEMERKLKD